MTENIINSTIDEAKKRLFESPFWSTFIISWLVINWKVLFITTSLNSTTISDKINAIEELHPNLFDRIISLGILPFIASFIAIAIVPFINHFYIRLRKYHRDRDADIEIKEAQKEIEVIEVKKDLQEKEKELEKSEQEEWNKEYGEIEKLGIIPELVQFIFKYHGSKSRSHIPTFHFVSAIKFGLLIQEDEDRYKFSKKGDYMFQKYPADKLKERFPIINRTV